MSRFKKKKVIILITLYKWNLTSDGYFTGISLEKTFANLQISLREEKESQNLNHQDHQTALLYQKLM